MEPSCCRQLKDIPDGERVEIAEEYSSGIGAIKISRKHFCSHRIVYKILRLFHAILRPVGEATRSSCQNEDREECLYLPSAEEIEKTARQIREEGFVDSQGLEHSSWSRRDRIFRSGGLDGKSRWELPVVALYAGDKKAVEDWSVHEV